MARTDEILFEVIPYPGDLTVRVDFQEQPRSALIFEVIPYNPVVVESDNTVFVAEELREDLDDIQDQLGDLAADDSAANLVALFEENLEP